MNRRPNRMAACGLALALSAGAWQPSLAVPRAEPEAIPLVTTVQADCYAVGQRVAAQNGGTLARASAQSQGGQTVCVIVVLMPARDGQRPRRAEFVVPAG